MDAPFDVVVTTNSGYPLDLNLYQGVKGMSAAVRIVKPGGTIIMACECSQGVPANCSFDQILRSASSPQEVLAMLATPGFSRPEQWQAQIQALIQTKARVLLYSSLPEEAGPRSASDSLSGYLRRGPTNVRRESGTAHCGFYRKAR